MQLSIHGQGLQIGSETRQHVAHRLGFSLGRLADRIRRVEVFLADVNGPRGGDDKVGRIVVYLPRHAPVVIEERSANLITLIDRAAGRLGQTVRRLLARSRRH